MAGRSRSLPTDELEAELAPMFERLKATGARHVHYKTCSTFDSSPAIGSIGRVIDVACGVIDTPFVPVVVGTPGLGRWVAFGNLFATVGIGSDGEAHRLDRHPAMSVHPVTPAGEADLRRVLAEQTRRRIGLIDCRTLEHGLEAIHERLQRLRSDEGAEIVVFDTLSVENLKMIGEVLERYATPERPLFSVGSSAIETALTAFWSSTGETVALPKPPSPTLVLVGSCSPVTWRQAEAARRAGVQVATLNPLEPGDNGVSTAVRERLAAGESVVVTTGQDARDTSASPLPAGVLGEAFARLVEACRAPLADGTLVIAGGDTSSYTVRALGAESLTMEAPLVAGAPLCRLAAPGRSADGLRVVLKGGQVGEEQLLTNWTTR